MKVGDLVKDNHPSWFGAERVGMIIGNGTSVYHNNAFKVWWRDGTIGNDVWDYDLKVIDK